MFSLGEAVGDSKCKIADLERQLDYTSAANASLESVLRHAERHNILLVALLDATKAALVDERDGTPATIQQLRDSRDRHLTTASEERCAKEKAFNELEMLELDFRRREKELLVRAREAEEANKTADARCKHAEEAQREAEDGRRSAEDEVKKLKQQLETMRTERNEERRCYGDELARQAFRFDLIKMGNIELFQKLDVSREEKTAVKDERDALLKKCSDLESRVNDLFEENQALAVEKTKLEEVAKGQTRIQSPKQKTKKIYGFKCHSAGYGTDGTNLVSTDSLSAPYAHQSASDEAKKLTRRGLPGDPMHFGRKRVLADVTNHEDMMSGGFDGCAVKRLDDMFSKLKVGEDFN